MKKNMEYPVALIVNVVSIIIAISFSISIDSNTHEAKQIEISRQFLVFFKDRAQTGNSKIHTFPVSNGYKNDKFDKTALAVDLGSKDTPGLNIYFLKLVHFWNKIADILHHVDKTSNYQYVPIPSNEIDITQYEESFPFDVFAKEDEINAWKNKKRIDEYCYYALLIVDRMLELYVKTKELPYSEGRLLALHDIRNELINIQYCKGETSGLIVISFLFYLVACGLLFAYLWFHFAAIQVSIVHITNKIIPWNLITLFLILFVLTFFIRIHMFSPYFSIMYSFTIAALITLAHGLVCDKVLCPKTSDTTVYGYNSYIRLLLIFIVFYTIFFAGWSLMILRSDFTVGSTKLDLSNIALLNTAALFFLVTSIICGISTWHKHRYFSYAVFFVGIIPFIISILFHQQVTNIYPMNIFYYLYPNGPAYDNHYALYIEIFLSRVCFFVPLLILVLWKTIDRKSTNKQLAIFLETNNEKPFQFSIPLFGNIILHPHGILVYPLFKNNNKKDIALKASLPTLASLIMFGLSNIAGSLKSIIQSCRPINVALAMLMTLYSFLYSLKENIVIGDAIMAMFSIGLMIGAQMMFNDCIDYRIDKINKKWRPIASGKLKLENAYIVSFVFMVISLLIASISNNLFFFYLAAFCISCIYYSFYLKKNNMLLANVLSSTVTTSICLSGLFWGTFYIELLWITLSAFFACMAREILKDIEDMNADRKYRRGSLHSIIGVAGSLNIAKVCIILQCIFSYCPYFYGTFDSLYLIVITAINIYLIVTTIYKASVQLPKIVIIHKRVKLSMVLYTITFFVISIL